MIDTDKKVLDEIEKGWKHTTIDGNLAVNKYYSPDFIFNNNKQGIKVLPVIEEELKNCDSFIISVAFITNSGITPLLMTLKELEARKIKGKIITTDYLTFTEPKALDKLNEFKNIELKMYQVGDGEGFHTKGYIFSKDEINIIIIGSSNITGVALTKNREWNTRIVSTKNGAMYKSVMSEYNILWNSEKAKKYSLIRDEYILKYNLVKQQKRIAAASNIIDLPSYQLEPNKMQLSFLQNLRKLKEEGAKRMLLISATGTGKSYASAFAVREENPEKTLFIVHREDIAKQAMKSYGKVFGKTKTMGLLTGNSKDFDADIIFATVQTISKLEIYEKFNKYYFNLIIIDEVHRAGAPTYQKLMNYFKPNFYLGMTASPERTDGFDIFSLFDNNIACEIRLQDALNENLLCPFHYFGITDLEFDGKIIGDKVDFKNFKNIEKEKRADYVIDQAEFFGYSGDRVRGLIFCSRVDEADFMAEAFRKRGYRTLSLGGKDSPVEREKAIKRLMAEAGDDALDYIFTVDIFNEGVDIPNVNQIIMLRPTESPIVFVQQLGRGLRKSNDKDFVVILDFIGNYQNSYMIPLALSGDRSYNKDNMRKYVDSGNRIIPGASTIHFDEISRKRIFSAIDSAKTNTIKLIKDSYQNLKYKLGKIPGIMDFKIYGEIEIEKIFAKCGSYHEFLKEYEPEYKVEFSKEKENILVYLSLKIGRAKRLEELVILKTIVELEEDADIFDFELDMSNMNERKIESVVSNLVNTFCTKNQREKFKGSKFIEKSEKGWVPARKFVEYLSDTEFKKQVKDILEYGIDLYNERYSNKYNNTDFVLGEKYSYEDVCHLLDWKENLNAQNIGGYFYDKKTKTLPVFINYEKSDDAIQYNDRFISKSSLIAISKHPRKVDSSDADHIFKRKKEDKDNKIFLFVRKNKDDKEAKEFYFLGEIIAEGEPKSIEMMQKNKITNAFEINYKLDTAVREDIYNYIIE